MEDIKSFSRSKHFHSLHKDKNRWKKKAKHLPPKPKVQPTQEEPTEEEEEDSENEETNNGEKQNQKDNQEQQAKPRRRGKYSRRVIESNDYRYSVPIEQDDAESERDYYRLSDSVTSSSSNFKFDAEMEWNESEWQATDAKVEIDVEELSERLASLPLSQLLDIDPTLLPTESQHVQSNSAAKESTSKSGLPFILTPHKSHSPPAQPKQQQAPLVDKTEQKDEELLNELLANSTPSNSSTATPAPQQQQDEQQKAEEDDLEKWLDTVI